MRARDQFATTTLRTLMSAIKNLEIEKQKKEEGLSDEETIDVIAREIKQRRDAVAEFTKGDRLDLVQKAQSEITILKRYMPEALSENGILDIIRDALNSTGAKSMADFGAVMKEVVPKTKGRADGSHVAQLIKDKLK